MKGGAGEGAFRGGDSGAGQGSTAAVAVPSWSVAAQLPQAR
jgi:hypothetical protein